MTVCRGNRKLALWVLCLKRDRFLMASKPLGENETRENSEKLNWLTKRAASLAHYIDSESCVNKDFSQRSRRSPKSYSSQG